MAASSLRSVGWIALVCGSISLYAGCGRSEQQIDGRASVSGNVVFDGKPLPAGTISFSGVDEPASTAVKIREGFYFTDRVPLGQNRVSIDTESIQMGNPAKYVAIPAKYSDATTSGLTADIQAGENENVNFTLDAK